MNKKIQKLLLDGDCLKEGIARGDVLVVLIPPQSKRNDTKMKKRSGILYGSTIWTDDQILYFYKKHDGNASAASRELRMTLGAYKQRLHKLGLRATGGVPQRYSDEEIIAAMKETNNNMRAASRIIGCNHHTLKDRVPRLGLIKPSKRDKRIIYTDKRIRNAMKKAGNNMSEAARLLGCSYWTLSNRAKRLGLKSRKPWSSERKRR